MRQEVSEEEIAAQGGEVDGGLPEADGEVNWKKATLSEYGQRTSSERWSHDEDRASKERFKEPEGIVVHVRGSEKSVLELEFVIFDEDGEMRPKKRGSVATS